MAMIPKVNEIYKHFKGDLYQITAIAQHTETGETLVIYQAMYGDLKTYARPLEMFMSPVDKEKYPDVEQEYRFELQDLEAEPVLDPMIIQFLDAENYSERLNILAALEHRITDEMITTMAIACDVEVEEGDVETRFYSLKNCLSTLEKYECNRLR